MHRGLWRFFIIVAAIVMTSFAAAADDPLRLQEEVWALLLPTPTIAYVARPVGDGPFPVAIMSHGVALDPVQRAFCPLVELRDAAMWFARRGYLVVAFSPGYGATALDVPESGLFTVFFSKIGKCTYPNFRDAGLAAAQLNLWIIEYMSTLKRIAPDNVIVIGQSAGGWASIALSTVNPRPVTAIITFAAGRGGRVDDKLVEATCAFGRTSHVPMLWLYIENHTPGGAEMVCRTTIAGQFETGPIAVRMYLVEREGDNIGRLQLFLPVGLHVPAGATLTIGKGTARTIPFTWCLTNTCIADDIAKPELLREMETGSKLATEVVDTNMLAVATSLPLNQFAVARTGALTKTFKQYIEE